MANVKDKLARISGDIERLQVEIDAALLDGREDEAARVQRRIAKLESERSRLRDQAVRRSNHTRGDGARLTNVLVTDEFHSLPDPPVAELVTEALALLDASADGRSLSDLIAAFHEVHVSPGRIAVLRRDDERAFRRSMRAGTTALSRPSLVVPALHFDRLVPIRGRYALSDWEPPRRIVGPRSIRRDHLEHVLRLAQTLEEISTPDDPHMEGPKERLVRLLARRAQTIPGAIGDVFDLERIRSAAAHELGVIAPLDDDARREASERLTSFEDATANLFGSEDLQAIPGGAEA